MPRTTVTPPAFDDLGDTSQTFTPPQDFSFTENITIQDFIFDSVWAELFTFSLVISLVLAIGIIYSMLRTYQIRKAEVAYYSKQPLSSVARRVFEIGEQTPDDSGQSVRWRSVMEHANSDNANDWRQAILEADIILDDAITNRGYSGDGLGEKMKQVKRGDINSIDDAWEAHKIRNRVAHEGTDFKLTQREVRRVISLYERTLRELNYINS